MKIAVATLGRFWMLDLARELSHQGHHVAFYSVLPKRRALQFGLPEGCYRGGIFIWLAPLLLAQRYGGSWLRCLVKPWILRFADWLIAQRLEQCDLFIGISGLCVKSPLTARQRFASSVWIERGSQHILSQKAILDHLKTISPTADTVSAYDVKRELDSYDAADIVLVPSTHAALSFVEQGFSFHRLFVNPYGVDILDFAPTPMPPFVPKPTVVFVGTWSYRKGCDLMATAFEQLGGRVQLLHVGPVSDAPLPANGWFVHHDPVPQYQLKAWYSLGHVFVLASREDGFGMVLSQALACGLPVVCTDRTGGQDLIDMLGLTEGIFVVPHDDPVALAAAIDQAVQWAHHRFQAGENRDLLGSKRELLSWHAYGQRYSHYLSTLNT